MKGIANALATGVCLVALASPAQAQERSFDIPAGNLKAALDAYSRQAGQPIIYKPEQVRGARSSGFKGAATARAALDAVLAQSGFVAQSGSTGAIAIVKGSGTPQGNALAGAPNADTEVASLGDEGTSAAAGQEGISEILVVGSRSQNVDIRRTEDDPQPYVVFDAEEIEKSQAADLEDFFRRRLPMNTQQGTSAQAISLSSNAGRVNLRGLGTSQTLILIDGRRAPRLVERDTTGSPTTSQADINGIPLAAIERIEILPATAGGIYGGGAVGGVINIIRKRGFHGLDVDAQVNAPTRGGGEDYKISFSGGASVGDGRTQLTFSTSYSRSEPLFAADNSLVSRGRMLYNRNSPDDFGNLRPGTTGNIRSADGSDLVLKPEYGGADLGSNHTFIPPGFGGIDVDDPFDLIANAGAYNLNLSPDANGSELLLRRSKKAVSANVNIRQTITSGIDVYTDITAYRSDASMAMTFAPLFVDASSPSNPFAQAVYVAYPLEGAAPPARLRSSSMAFTLGGVFRLPRSWSASGEYQRSRARNYSSYVGLPLELEGLAAAAIGTINLFADPSTYSDDLRQYLRTDPDSFVDFKTRESIVTARASGPLLRLPGGNLTSSFLVERRREVAPTSEIRQTSEFLGFEDVFNQRYPRRSQRVTSAYAELNAPLIGEKNNLAHVHELLLQGSIRHDSYATFIPEPSSYDPRFSDPDLSENRSNFSSTNYTLAARWQPWEGLAFRASYSTGFLPPSVSQLTPSGIVPVNFPFAGLPDPRRGGELVGTASPFDFLFGGNSRLRPESSRSLSIGAIIRLAKVPGLRIAVDYLHLRKADEITTLEPGLILANEDIFSDRVIRGPNLPSDQAGWAGPITSFDQSLVNVSRAKVRSVDVQFEYERQTEFGTIKFYSNSTYQPSLERRIAPAASQLNFVGYSNGPLRWRGNLGIDWERGGLAISANTQWYDDYRIESIGVFADGTLIRAQGSNRVPSQWYSDVSVAYQLANGIFPGARDTVIRFGIENIFDRRPPVLAAPSTSTGYSLYGDPRLRRIFFGIRAGI